MKKLIYLLLISLPSFSQSIMLTGSLKNTQNEWLMGATVKLFTSDSTFIKGSISDEKGLFRIENLNPGSYYLKITALTFQDFQGIGFEINDSDIDLPVIYLLPSKAIELNAVTVKARKPLIEQEIDRTIINVEAMISAATSNTLEVLERTPGVIVDAQGNINLNGKSGVIVLIDGRITYMSGQDLAAYLKSLPGSMLEKLELMDNPPAKYDAAGGAIINIVLKKNRSLGLTGNVALGGSQGQNIRSNNSINVNFNRKKINLFTNIGLSIDGNYQKETAERRIFTENGSLITDIQLNSLYNYHSNGLLSRVGMDINVSDKTVIGIQGFFQNRPKNENLNYTSTSQGNAEIKNFNGLNSGDFYWNTKGANFNFNHKFNTKGREISGDLNYINYGSDGLKSFENVSQNSIPAFTNKLTGNINIFNFKTDYSHPLTKGAKIDAGLKSSYVKNDNDAIFNTIQSSSSEIDYTRSNHFIYNENINAAYFNLQKSITKKLNSQVGLRAENTNLLGELLPNQSISGERFIQNFTNIFPSVFLSYKLDSLNKHTINLSYARRINRPNYQQFNPFLNYQDAFTYSQGNTELHPFYLHNIRLRYQYKQFYTLNFGYDGADGIFGDITIRRGETFIKTPYNVGTGFRLGIDQNISFSPSKKWKTNINLNLARFHINGKADGYSGLSIFYAFILYNNNQFDFGKGWSGELMGYLSSRNKFYPSANLARVYFYSSIQKKILKDKGSLRLSIDDITHTNFNRSLIADFQNTYQYTKSVNDTQRVGLAFTYRFGNEKFVRKRRHQDNAAQEEQGRVN